MQDRPYVHSIMTTIFTKDGDLVVIMNENKELDTLPQYFMGHKEDKSYSGEGGIDILNHEDEYKEAVGYFFGLKSNSTAAGIKNGFLLGSKESLTDCGQLHPAIATVQIKEMKKRKTPLFIRVKKEIFEIIIENQEILNQIQTRYVVIPNLELEEYHGINVFSVEELEEIKDEGKIKLSPRLLWQLSKEEVKEIKKFSNKLKNNMTIQLNKKRK